MTIVGLTGYAQHGKDSTGKLLVEEFGFKRYAFADNVKEMAYRLDPYVAFETDREGYTVEPAVLRRLQDVVDYDGWELAKQRIEVRRLLQVLGTECVRNIIGPDSWVEAVGRQLAVDRPDHAVITDVRFPNEAQFIRLNGGIIVRVDRPGFDNGLGTDHPSESGVDSIVPDDVISATNLAELETAVRAQVRTWL